MQFRDHPGVQGKRDAYPFDPRLLKIDAGFNVRDLDAPDELADLAELKESIRANGVRVPLEVRLVEDDVFVLAGHRRHKAVMELIAEGEEIKTVPVMPEPKFTSDGDRILNLIVSNSGKPLKPLEIAEVVRRLVAFGWDKTQIAKRVGWKSAASVTQHLELLALPEPVKESVRQGDISATQANKFLKNLPKGTDPNEAAKMIAANKEENKRLGVGKRTNHKVTAKTLARDKPKAPKAPETPKEDAKPKANEIAIALNEAAKSVPTDPETGGKNVKAVLDQAERLAAGGQIFSPLSDATPPIQQETGPRLTEADFLTRMEEIAPKAPTPTRIFPPEAFQPPSPAADFDREMFAIIARLATIAEENCIGERGDDEMIGVPAEVIKAADRAYRSRIGDESDKPRDARREIEDGARPKEGRFRL